MSRDANENVYDVIIIGAGVAGITCAVKLLEKGINNILLLEGSDRVGGRVRCSEFFGVTIEEGANWIAGIKDGEVENLLLPLSRKCNLIGNEEQYLDESRYLVLNENGKNETAEFLQRWSKLRGHQDEWNDSSDESSDECDMTISDALGLTGWIPDSHLDFLAEWWSIGWEMTFACHQVTSENLRKYNNFEHLGNGEFMCLDQRGFIHLFDDQIKQVEPFVKLNSVVTAVNFVKLSDECKGTDVFCCSQLYKSRFVVFTGCSKILTSDLIQFTPELPSDSLKAVSNLSFGYDTKIFIKFQSKFWGEEEFIFYSKPISGKSTFLNFQNLSSLENYRGPDTILLTSIQGNLSLFIEGQTDDYIQNFLVNILTKMYGEKVSKCEGIHLMRFSTNNLFRASYCLGVKNASDEYWTLKTVNTIIYDRLILSGEATVEYCGYVGSAIESGQKAANKIIAFFNRFNLSTDPSTEQLPAWKANKNL